jgi:DNA-directed RNA polymerase subunit RPC12/RpoP
VITCGCDALLFPQEVKEGNAHYKCHKCGNTYTRKTLTLIRCETNPTSGAVTEIYWCRSCCAPPHLRDVKKDDKKDDKKDEDLVSLI